MKNWNAGTWIVAGVAIYGLWYLAAALWMMVGR